MIKFYKNYVTKSDSRGSMKGLINEGEWKELNFFSTKAGQVRGDHYHKNTDELFIILEGEIKIILTDIKSEKSKEVLVKEGDVFVIKRKIVHTFFIIKDTKWINGLSQKMDKENPDFHY